MIDAIVSEILRELPKQIVGALVEQGVGTVWKKISDPDKQEAAEPDYLSEDRVSYEQIFRTARQVTDRDVGSAVAVADWFFAQVRDRRFESALNACHPTLSYTFNGHADLQRCFHPAPPPEPWSFTQYCVHAGAPGAGPVLQLIGTIRFGSCWTAFSLWMALQNEEWRLSGWEFDFQGNATAA